MEFWIISFCCWEYTSVPLNVLNIWLIYTRHGNFMITIWILATIKLVSLSSFYYYLCTYILYVNDIIFFIKSLQSGFSIIKFIRFATGSTHLNKFRGRSRILDRGASRKKFLPDRHRRALKPVQGAQPGSLNEKKTDNWLIWLACSVWGMSLQKKKFAN